MSNSLIKEIEDVLAKYKNEPTQEPTEKDLTNLVIYLNAGHGNFDGVNYHTFASDGKFYRFTDGGKTIYTAYEGETNRIFAELIRTELVKRGAEVVVIHQKDFDTHNFQRIQIANNHFASANKTNKKFLWLSLHSNAMSMSFEGAGSVASGIEIFTSNNASANSVNVANRFMMNSSALFQKYKVANRGHKKGDFTELVGTQMPAVLIENLFFDNLREARLLKDKEYQADFTIAVMNTLAWYAKN